MNFWYNLLGKILQIFNQILDIRSLFAKKNYEKKVAENEKKDNELIKKTVEDNISNNDLDKINDDLGWKP